MRRHSLRKKSYRLIPKFDKFWNADTHTCFVLSWKVWQTFPFSRMPLSKVIHILARERKVALQFQKTVTLCRNVSQNHLPRRLGAVTPWHCDAGQMCCLYYTDFGTRKKACTAVPKTVTPCRDVSRCHLPRRLGTVTPQHCDAGQMCT